MLTTEFEGQAGGVIGSCDLPLIYCARGEILSSSSDRKFLGGGRNPRTWGLRDHTAAGYITGES